MNEQQISRLAAFLADRVESAVLYGKQLGVSLQEALDYGGATQEQIAALLKREIN